MAAIFKKFYELVPDVIGCQHSKGLEKKGHLIALTVFFKLFHLKLLCKATAFFITCKIFSAGSMFWRLRCELLAEIYLRWVIIARGDQQIFARTCL